MSEMGKHDGDPCSKCAFSDFGQGPEFRCPGTLEQELGTLRRQRANAFYRRNAEKSEARLQFTEKVLEWAQRAIQNPWWGIGELETLAYVLTDERSRRGEAIAPKPAKE